MPRTHYDVLGVSARATDDELRRAYRERARVLHPDRLRGGGAEESGVLGTGMRELNEAWRVLRDPQQRAAYDRTLAKPPTAPGRDDDELDDWDRPFRGRPAEPGDLMVALVRALPWLLVGLLLGGIFVFTAFAGGGGEPPPRQLVGDCVRASSTLLEVVPCAPGGVRVDAVTHAALDCATGTTPVPSGRDRVLCLRPFTGASP